MHMLILFLLLNYLTKSNSSPIKIFNNEKNMLSSIDELCNFTIKIYKSKPNFVPDSIFVLDSNKHKPRQPQ
jgi:hypothetical protein